MSRECEADRSGRRLSRDDRKALRIADLQDCTAERRAELRKRAEEAIARLERCRDEQRSNGIPVSDEQHRRNTASHVLMLECLAQV